MKTVLILGSAPDAIRATQFDLTKISAIIALNNAWQIRPEWTHAIYPEDFPEQRRPKPEHDQEIVTHEQYVPANNIYGGIIYAGATMAFTASYWALHTLKPDLMLFCGCDMIYNNQQGKSHFYGDGEADPLRSDPTLQSLEAKSNRIMIHAAQDNCACANLSDLPKTRLTFQRLDIRELETICADEQRKMLLKTRESSHENSIQEAKSLEKKTEYFHAAGDYWKADFTIDTEKLAQIDALWLSAVQNHNDDVIE